jgi:CRP/FNR family transcriptional regulator, cyclic AMP receptor protein
MAKRWNESLEQLLLGVSWLRNLPESARARVAADAYEMAYPAGGTVVRKGEPANSWIGVAEGLLKVSAVYRTGKVVMFTGIPDGGWIGEGAVIKRELRKYDIIAMRDSRVIHIPGPTFRWLLDTSIEFNHFIIAHLNERLGQYIGMVETDRLTDPVARLARAIASLFNPVLYPGTHALLTVSQSELGELAGLSRQTTNAAIKQLQAAGLLSAEYGGVLVKSVEALRGYVESEHSTPQPPTR